MLSNPFASAPLSRRRFLAGTAALTLSPAAAADAPGNLPENANGIVNPVVRQRADAQVLRHDDGTYYMTASVPEYDRLVLRRAKTLEGLHDAEEAVLWRRPRQGRMGGYIWAPELHHIDGRWHMYFAAGDADSVFRIRTYAIVCDGQDPMTGAWSVLGRMEMPWDSFTLDSTSFVHRGVRYFCWAQGEAGIDANSNIYLAPMAGPLKLAAAPVRLTTPTLPWETAGEKVNEAPAFLAHGDKVFLTYSAGATDANYCLGILAANAGADLMNPASWRKSPRPVFATSAVTGVFGPGHNSFTVDEAGRDILVYHGRDYEKIVGSPLRDPNRHTRMQRITYRPDGTPDFGIPVGNGPLPVRLSVEKDGNAVLRHDGSRVFVGAGPLAASQFREVPGPAGTGTVSLQPIDAPELRLCADAAGMLTLAHGTGSAFAAGTRFTRLPGRTGRQTVSYELTARPGAYLQLSDRGARVRPVRTAAERRAATLYCG